MPRTRKETTVSEDTAPVTAPETVVDPVEAAKAEAEAILEAAKREAALIAQAAREAEAAAKAKTADWQPLPEEAPEVPVNALPEPSVSAAARAGKAVGRVVETGVVGIVRIDY